MDNDLAYLHASLESLEDFLLSKEIFYSLGTIAGQSRSSAISRLSLGGLLLALQRVKATLAGPSEAPGNGVVVRQVEELRDRWRSHWSQKAQKEFSSRLNQWKNFLSDLEEAGRGAPSNYPQEVRLRAMLTILAQEAGHIEPHEDALLFTLDQKLRALFQPGDFVWDSSLAPGFPPDSFWFLYGSIRS